ncbi:hypothetical protein [Aggregatibacter actinomycetemcomitans]
MLLLSDLSSAPWTVLSQGVALQGQFSVGWASCIISLIVMLAWFPLKLRTGLATVMNIFVIALVLGLTTYYRKNPPHFMCALPTPSSAFCCSALVRFGIGRVVQYTLLFISRMPYFSDKSNHLR